MLLEMNPFFLPSSLPFHRLIQKEKMNEICLAVEIPDPINCVLADSLDLKTQNLVPFPRS